jgi:phosphoribosylformimino-5-aminoimidazole carboxamide ribotide isomerase
MTTTNFIVFPAIDLRHGRVVRLKEGDPSRQTEYSPSPANTAAAWLAAKASWLHVVNLDGAFGDPDSANLQALAAILSEASRAGAKVQFGGGLRTPEAVNQALSIGVERAILGTLAVESPGVVKDLVARWGAGRIGVSLDARAGFVQVRGWQANSGIPAVELACTLAQQGLVWLVYTDIARDGLQGGLNLPATHLLAEQSGLQVIASGGVASWEDIRGARQANLAGAIVGKALYEGVFDPQKLFAFNQTSPEDL